jgi:hypothetical protein
MSRTKAAPTVANGLGANMKLFGIDDPSAGTLFAANSNASRPSRSGPGFGSTPEIVRLLRAFNSIKDHDLRWIVLKFVETTAGTEHIGTKQG